MASKRTLKPFYGKPEARLEREINQVQQRMRAAGANTIEISEMLQYGRAELDKKMNARKERFRARHGSVALNNVLQRRA